MNSACSPESIRLPSGCSASRTSLAAVVLAGLLLGPSVSAQLMSIDSDVAVHASLVDETVSLSGNAELRLTGATPLSGCTVDLSSPDAWLVFSAIDPADSLDGLLAQVTVDGQPAVADVNVRVMRHASGTAIVAQGPDFLPLEVFSGPAFTGSSASPTQLDYHRSAALGEMNDAISSFTLKRGYMATFAENDDGTGASKVFIAQDGDLAVNVMPPGLDDSASFVRIFPWSAVGKKGWSGGIPDGSGMAQLGLDWHYDWDNWVTSSRSTEYVPMRHNAGWNSWANINNKIGSTHVLGFNEPDRPDQANMTVDQAIALWPNLLASGLRIGSPAPASANWTSNADWLGQFIERADALQYRVDFVALHFYQANWSAQSLYDYLRAIYVRTRRPIWITEMNNGANWTDDAQPNLTQAQNSSVLQSFVQIMDSAPFVERYAMYNWVGDNRAMVLYDAEAGVDVLTPAGEMYRDHRAPAAFTAENPPIDDTRFEAFYPLDGSLTDASGSASPATSGGTPTFVPGVLGQALQFDGTHDHVQLPAKIAGGTDFTFAAWVRWDGGASFQRIFDFGCDTTEYMFLTPSSSANTLRFSITEGSYPAQLLMETAPLVPGEWTHVAVTLQNNTGKLFVNGTKAAENTSMTINPMHLAAWSNYLGKSHYASDPHFAGALDEVVISDTAFSEERIASMVSNTPPSFTATPVIAPVSPAGRLFRWSVAGSVIDNESAESELHFTKAGGPEWLELLPDGTLHGLPPEAGRWEVAVAVSDPSGSADLASVVVEIVPAAPLPPSVGPLAHYRFDGTTRSAIGSHHAIASGTPAYVAGEIDEAIDLDGVDDSLTLPAALADTAEMTFGAWVRWDGGATYQRIFDFGAGTSSYAFLTPNSGGSTCRFAITTSGNGGETRLNAPGPLTVGEWTHLAVTLDGITARLWLDGLEVDNTPLATTPSDLAATNLYLGRSQFSADPLFDGQLDEVQIFDRALGGPEIVEMMAGDLHGPRFSGSPLDGGTVAAGVAYQNDLLPLVTDPDEDETFVFLKTGGPAWLEVSRNGLLHGTPSDGDSGPNLFGMRVIDSTGRSDEAELAIEVVGTGSGALAAYAFEGDARDHVGGADGILTGAAGFVAGRRGNALEFDGSTTAVTLPAGLIDSADFTVATWMRWDGGAIWQRVFDFGADTDRYLFITPRSGSNTLRFAIKPSAGASEQRLEVASPPPGTWIHVAVTLSGTTGRMYVDGAEVASGPITADPADLEATLLYLGDSLFASDPSFDGALDDFEIHARALSAAEVGELVRRGTDAAGEAFAEWSERLLPAGSLPEGDHDGDGTANLAEFRLGLHPADARSAFRAWLADGDLHWPSGPGIRFQVERNTTLETAGWKPFGQVDGITGTDRWPAPEPAEGAAFYRVRFDE